MKNGRPKAENTRHINIRYFHIADYMERDEIILKYVDTNNQHADYFYKVNHSSSIVNISWGTSGN